MGVDGSPASELALRWALNQGALTGAAVEAVNAWQVPQVPGGRVSMMGVDFSAISEEILRNAVEAVGASPESVTESTVQGHPAQALVDASDGAELLVVGNRGHGGFTGLLLGSVSGHVLAHASLPHSYRARVAASRPEVVRPGWAHDSCWVAFCADTAAIFLGSIAAATRPINPTSARAAMASP